jgi:hypothetical protein
MAHALLPAGLALFIGLSAASPSDARPSNSGAAPFNPTLILETVHTLGIALTREYFDPAVAAKASETLGKHLAEGRYQKVSTCEELAKALTDDLYAMTKDKHLVVSPADLAIAVGVDSTPRAVVARRSNFGIQRIEVLSGNVGYLNLTAFYRPDEAREAIAAAMASLRHTDALILDLRENGGGSSGTLALMASYFFEAQGLPLFEVAPRPPAKAANFATEAEPLANRNQQRPTYILTSGNTWSAGEGLAFILQERHRAEVVGQTTAGAGNQARPHLLNARFEVTIPNGSVRSAVRQKSWEGTGVVPDISVESSDALRVAHARALHGLMRAAPSGPWRDALGRYLAPLEAKGK